MQTRSTRVRLAALAVALGAVSAGLWVAAPVTAQSGLLVVASGLDNPRGLAFGPDRALYVAEAGRGGNSTLCLPEPEPPPGRQRCYGASGAITRITGLGVQQRVVTGLPSLAVASGENATGPSDIDFAFGSAWVPVGSGGDPATRAPFTAANIRLGSLVQITSTGAWNYVLDLAAIESATNPDGGTVDSNAYALRVLADRGVLVDAGANALFNIGLNGTMTTLATFPRRFVTNPVGPGTIPMESVPTTVAVGPDGNYYVGELTGFPFPPGQAQIYRVPPTGGAPTVIATGFTNIIDIAISPAGVGYVLELDADSRFAPVGPSPNGRLTRVDLNGTRTVLASAGLIQPGGVTIGPDGALYVTNRSGSAGTGEVVRIAQ